MVKKILTANRLVEKTTGEGVDVTDIIHTHVTNKNTNIGVVTIPTITDNLNGSISIADNGIFNIKLNVDSIPSRITATNTATLTMTDLSVNYVYFDFSDLTYKTSTTQPFLSSFTILKCMVAIVTRFGTSLFINTVGAEGLSLEETRYDLGVGYDNLIIRHLDLQLSILAGTRQFQVSSGHLMFGAKYMDLPLASTDIGLRQFYKVSGVWTKSSALTEYDSSYYNGVTSNDLIALTANYYTNKYVFRLLSDTTNELVYINSPNQYLIRSEAVKEQMPSVLELPAFLLENYLFVGKIVVCAGEATGEAFNAIKGTYYVLGGVTINHNELTNVQKAGTGIEYGHIDNTTQTIYGSKRFDDEIKVEDLNPITTEIKTNGTFRLTDGKSYYIGDATNYVRLHCTGANSYIDYSTGNLNFRRGSTNMAIFYADGGAFFLGTLIANQNHSREQTLTDGATISWDCAGGAHSVVTLGGNRTLANPTNIKTGCKYLLVVKQDGTGGRTLTFSSYFYFPGNIRPALTATGGAIDVFEFYGASATALYCTNFVANLRNS